MNGEVTIALFTNVLAFMLAQHLFSLQVEKNTRVHLDDKKIETNTVRFRFDFLVMMYDLSFFFLGIIRIQTRM